VEFSRTRIIIDQLYEHKLANRYRHSAYFLSSCSRDIPFIQNSMSIISSPSTLLIDSQYQAQMINALAKTNTSSRCHIHQSPVFLKSVLHSASNPNNFQRTRYTSTIPVGMNKRALLLTMPYQTVLFILELN
jgi:hypothetical protein